MFVCAIYLCDYFTFLLIILPLPLRFGTELMCISAYLSILSTLPFNVFWVHLNILNIFIKVMLVLSSTCSSFLSKYDSKLSFNSTKNKTIPLSFTFYMCRISRKSLWRIQANVFWHSFRYGITYSSHWHRKVKNISWSSLELHKCSTNVAGSAVDSGLICHHRSAKGPKSC